jgi:hypothetical protein
MTVKMCIMVFWVVALKMEAIRFSEMLLTIYKITRRHNPGDHKSTNLFCCFIVLHVQAVFSKLAPTYVMTGYGEGIKKITASKCHFTPNSGTWAIHDSPVISNTSRQEHTQSRRKDRNKVFVVMMRQLLRQPCHACGILYLWGMNPLSLLAYFSTTKKRTHMPPTDPLKPRNNGMYLLL